MQAKFPLFYANIGDRIKWLRQHRGLSLSALGDGSASTAQSWEQGKHPRGDRWKGIAERLGVSWSLISQGVPSTAEDYTFIRDNRNLIDFQGAPPNIDIVVAHPGGEVVLGQLKPAGVREETQAPYGAPEMLRNEIRRLVEDGISAAGDDVGKLGWLREQLIRYASPPEHWESLEDIIRKAAPEEDRKDEEALRPLREEIKRLRAQLALAQGKAS